MEFKEPITLEGKNKIDEELSQLIKVDREEIKVKISEARELGDLKENAEYHSAKEKQSILEGRIAHLQGVISNCNVIDTSKIPNQDKIVFGATVVLHDEQKDAEVTYKIVGHEESDNRQGKNKLQKALSAKPLSEKKRATRRLCRHQRVNSSMR